MPIKRLRKKTFQIDIPAGLSITQMINLRGYDHVDEWVERLFRSDPELVGKWECTLINPRNYLTSDEAESLCKIHGQPSKIDHLLILGATYPELLEEYKLQIVALGDVPLTDYHPVPFLDHDGCESFMFHFDGQ